MFTGLVEAVGRLVSRTEDASGVRLRIENPVLSGSLSDGDSVAVDGVCLTVTEAARGSFAVRAVPATLGRTTLASIEPGRRLNLERAVRADSLLGGHLVQGHVDGVGVVESVVELGEGRRIRVRLPDEVSRLTVDRGSLAIDGVSLTVAERAGKVADVAIIPYTLGHTNLGRLAAGDTVNLEADVIGKYVQRLLEPYRPGTGDSPDLEHH